LKQRTGIEEYSYRVIENLKNYLLDQRVILYIRKNQEVDFALPKNWTVKKIHCPRLWTQLGLSFEMLFHPVDMLFVPAHTVPFVHPKNTVVTIHGLEYEFCPKAYSWFECFYMRLTIKKSCTWASKIISVSENTKKDLISLYGISAEKIQVIYEGYDRMRRNSQFPIPNSQTNPNDQIPKLNSKSKIQSPCLLFIGRIEERKNIANIIKAFEILKEKYAISHKLVLVGKPGYGYEKIKCKMQNSKYHQDIVELGFISNEKKWELLKKADVFVFPTQYEGFGIPILEAQSVGCVVVASNNSSIPEVAGDGAILIDPTDSNELAGKIFEIISNEEKKKDLGEKGFENVKRFDWDICASEIAIILK
jgi:glycosyltransferase involved in cell wall biosynthesis